MGRLYVVRHGQTQQNADAVLQGPRIDSDLSELGRLQSMSLANALRDVDLDALYVSPLKRARQTAQIIVEARKGERLAVQVVPELYEFDYGDLAGRPLEQIEGEVQQIFDAWNMGYVAERFPGGESVVLAQHRIRPIAERLRERTRDEELLVVAHGRINRVLITTLLGQPLERMQEYAQSNAGITELAWDDGLTLVRMDDTGHLDQKGPKSVS